MKNSGDVDALGRNALVELVFQLSKSWIGRALRLRIWALSEV